MQSRCKARVIWTGLKRSEERSCVYKDALSDVGSLRYVKIFAGNKKLFLKEEIREGCQKHALLVGLQWHHPPFLSFLASFLPLFRPKKPSRSLKCPILGYGKNTIACNENMLIHASDAQQNPNLDFGAHPSTYCITDNILWSKITDNFYLWVGRWWWKYKIHE